MTEAKKAAPAKIRWREWNDETFALARKLDKPVLLDIGAVWCHWCHVMEETVYDDPEVARLVSELYIPVQVDNDRRPDINERYNQGGWPTTAFLTPEGDILCGATYVPKEQFKQLLVNIASFYKANRADIGERVKELRAQQAAQARIVAPSHEGALASQIAEDIRKSAADFYDPVFGGFGSQMGNKFPQPELIDFLLYLHSATYDKLLLTMVERTLDGQAQGGMYDHVGGGFHRYSVKPDWRIPHFEKMLKDHAGHIRNYLEAYQATGKPLYRDIAVHTLGYVESILSDPAGGFYGSQDADVGAHDDGSYFTWSKDDLRAILTPGEYEVIVRHFGVDDDRSAMHEPHSSVIVAPSGEPASLSGAANVKHVLNVSFALEDRAKTLKIPIAEARALTDSGLAKMRFARAQRPTPRVDKHIFIDWNAMMVSSYLQAWVVLGEDKYRDFALKTLDRLLATCSSTEMGVAHYYDGKESHLFGLLADQVYMVRAFLDAYAAGGERRYLSTAERLMTIAKQRLYDGKGGGFWDIAAEGVNIGSLAIRRKSLEANVVAADDLMRLWFITGNPEYREMQQRTLVAFANSYEHLGLMAAAYGEAVAKFLSFPVEMTVVGLLKDLRTRSLLRACAAFYEPRKIVAPLDTKEDSRRIAELRYPSDSEPRVFVCLNKACGAPISDPDKLAESAQQFIKKNLRQNGGAGVG